MIFLEIPMRNLSMEIIFVGLIINSKAIKSSLRINNDASNEGISRYCYE